MAKKKKSDPHWMEKADAKMKKKGTKGSYGSKSDAQKKKDIAKGGKKGKKAQFALNVEKKKGKKK